MAVIIEDQSMSANLVQYARLNENEQEITNLLHETIRELIDYLKANRKSFSTNGPVAVMAGVQGKFCLFTDRRGKVVKSNNTLFRKHDSLIQISVTVGIGLTHRHRIVFRQLNVDTPFHIVEVDDINDLDVDQLFKTLCLRPMS